MKIVDLIDVPEAIDLLAGWHHQEWSYLNPLLSLAQRKHKMKNFLSPQFIPSTFVAQSERILGCAAIVESDMDTYKHFTPWLASVFVAPEERGQGIGSTLVKHVMAEAKKHGINKLYLFTPDQVPFYEKLGWKLMFKENYREHEVFVMCVVL